MPAVASSCRREPGDVRIVTWPSAMVKTKPFVKARCHGIVRAQAEVVESAVGRLDDVGHQVLPDPAHAIVASVRIDVQAADADQPPIDPRAEQGLSRPVKPIGPAGPLVDQPTDDAQARHLAVREQVVDGALCDLGQALDDQRAATRFRTGGPDQPSLRQNDRPLVVNLRPPRPCLEGGGSG
jgi:hypothetical protein